MVATYFVFVRLWRTCLGRFFSVNNVQHTVLQRLLVLAQSVLLPGEVKHLHVKLVAGETVFKHADALFVVGLLLEFERAAVLHELLELAGVTAAELLKRGLNLLLLDVIVLFSLASTRQALPRQRALQQIEQHVTDCFKIVASGLLDALVGVDAGIPGRAREVLAVLVRDVLALAVLEALSETEVDDVDLIFRLVRSSNQEVVWLNVAVNDSLLVHLLDAHQLNDDSEPQI